MIFYLFKKSINPVLRCEPEAAIFVASETAAAIMKETVKRTN